MKQLPLPTLYGEMANGIEPVERSWKVLNQHLSVPYGHLGTSLTNQSMPGDSRPFQICLEKVKALFFIRRALL